MRMSNSDIRTYGAGWERGSRGKNGSSTDQAKIRFFRVIRVPMFVCTTKG
jgi:hypothetical protein